MVTDDPGTPGNERWEINFAWTGERDPGATTQDAPLLDVNYGLGPRLQLKYELPWLVVNDSADGSRSGLGDSSAGVKWRFYDTGDPQRWQISTFPQYAFNSLSRSYRRGIVEQGAHLDLPVKRASAASRSTTRLAGSCALSVRRRTSGSPGWSWGGS